MSRRDVGTAVVGCGSWGSNHVRNLAELSRLEVCCDRDDGRLEALEARHPDVRTTRSFERILEDPAVEAVVVATPSSRHAEMAVRALGAGKHVLVEKPMALNVADAERLVEAADRSDRVLMVGHVMEHHPAVERLKGLKDEGELGEVQYLYSRRVNLGTVRSDENALWSLAPHDVSMMTWLLGEEPAEVEAHGASYLQPGIEDVVFIYLRFASGVVGHVHVSWLDPHKERELTVVGDRKMAVFDDMEPREKVRVYDKGADVTPGGLAGQPAAEVSLRVGEVRIPPVELHEPLARELEAFLRCVREGEEPRTGARDGLRVVRTIERAERALREGGGTERGPESGGSDERREGRAG